MSPNERIYAADLATLLGKTERTARRTLETLEQEHGSAVVRRDGRERFTTHAELLRLGVVRAPATEQHYDGAKLMAALRRQLADIAALVARVDAIDDRVTDLSVRLAHALA